MLILGDLTALIGTIGWVAYTRGQSKLAQLSVIEYTGFTAILAVPGLIIASSISTACREKPARYAGVRFVGRLC